MARPSTIRLAIEATCHEIDNTEARWRRGNRELSGIPNCSVLRIEAELRLRRLQQLLERHGRA